MSTTTQNKMSKDNIDTQIDEFIQERVDYIEEWKGNEYALLRKVADFVSGLYAQQQHPAGLRWIKASERLPEINKNVIIRFPWLDNTIVLDEGKLKPKEELDNQLWFSTNNYGSIPEQEDGLEWLDESAPSLLQEAGWIAVESAPKNGEYILLSNEAGVHKCRWSDSNEGSGSTVQFGWCIADSYGDEQGGWLTVDNPTHWQPLPAIPSK